MKRLAFAIIAVSAIVGLSFAQTPRPQAPRPTQTARQATETGRYQIFFSPIARADVYLVDTATGKIWRPINITNAEQPGLSGTPQVWMFQDRVDDNEQLAEWFSLYRKLPERSSTVPEPPPSAPTTPPASPQ